MRATRRDVYDARVESARQMVLFPKEWKAYDRCRPKSKSHYLTRRIGEVERIYPSGWMGIDSKEGVLRIRMTEDNQILFDAGENWERI